MRRRQAGFRQIGNALRKQRQLERDHGPVCFGFHTADSHAFDRFVEWKSEQYQRTGTLNLFCVPWVYDL